MKIGMCTAIVVLVAGVAGCGRPAAESDLIEIQRVHSGDVDVVLLSNDGGLTHGKDAVTVEFRRGDSLLDVGDVKARATMPMAGMAPMMGSVFLKRADQPGRYLAETDLAMSGGWQLALEWNGPAGKGSASLQATAE